MDNNKYLKLPNYEIPALALKYHLGLRYKLLRNIGNNKRSGARATRATRATGPYYHSSSTPGASRGSQSCTRAHEASSCAVELSACTSTTASTGPATIGFKGESKLVAFHGAVGGGD